MGNSQGNKAKAKTSSSAATTGETKEVTATTSTANVSATVANPTSSEVGLQVLTKDGPFFERTDKLLKGFTKGSDIGPSLQNYGDLFKHQFMFSFYNTTNKTYEVLLVQGYLASGGFAHVFMAKQVLAPDEDGTSGLGRSFAVKLMYKKGDTELERLDKREVSATYYVYCILCRF
jgi:hypothetical protein